MKSTPTAAKSSRNVPIDIADPTTPGVNVDGKYDTRKPVDHDSAAPERGEQFAPHHRAMPELCRREWRRSSARRSHVLRVTLAWRRRGVHAWISKFFFSGSSRDRTGSAFLSWRAFR
eukprot:347202-Prymnesium_polylepis.1